VADDTASPALDIAIIGMAGRFPGAPDVDRFWSELLAGKCSVTWLDGQPVEPAESATTVPAGYFMTDADRFDAEFFGVSPHEAELMDPQQRVLLECAWTLFESAGYDPAAIDGLVGVFVGGGFPYHHVRQVIPSIGAERAAEDKQVLLGNRPDFLATRISYRLGLTGPSMTVQAACSTSLVGVAQACNALAGYQADVAVAGGVAVNLVRRDG
jgi:acyl transferase domain-containing protein